jgi:hypothetical protein
VWPSKSFVDRCFSRGRTTWLTQRYMNPNRDSEPGKHGALTPGLFLTPEQFAALGGGGSGAQQHFARYCPRVPRPHAALGIPPHIKTYARLVGEGPDLAWIFLTSACLSKGAFGFENRSGTNAQASPTNVFCLRNFEMGIVFASDRQGGRRLTAAPLARRQSLWPRVDAAKVEVPLPYVAPPPSYWQVLHAPECPAPKVGASRSIWTPRCHEHGCESIWPQSRTPFFHDIAAVRFYPDLPWRRSDTPHEVNCSYSRNDAACAVANVGLSIMRHNASVRTLDEGGSKHGGALGLEMCSPKMRASETVSQFEKPEPKGTTGLVTAIPKMTKNGVQHKRRKTRDTTGGNWRECQARVNRAFFCKSNPLFGLLPTGNPETKVRAAAQTF